ncbi:MAG: hypothetical protein ACPLRU_00265 [Desulfofundulus sp.]|uniref:hypothetical protein n=1 Tax=Desulfofundulus sp. TaxID=2282750 RepID=UPI003C776494
MYGRRLLVRLHGPRKIGYDWRDKWQGVIFTLLGRGGIGGVMHGAKHSAFSYSLLPEEPLFLKDGLVSLNGFWSFRYSSVFDESVDKLADRFVGNKKVEVNGDVFRVVQVMFEVLPDRAVFPVVSALIIKKDHTFADPDGGFEELAVLSMRNKFRYFTGRDLPGDVGLSFVGAPRKKLIQYKNRNLLAFSGAVRVSGGGPEARVFAQVAGIGHKTGCGFGAAI